MNIFILHKDPIRAAKMQCDKHVVKMVLETAQMLCTVYPEGLPPYKRNHYNHPCTIWTRTSKNNFLWLCEHGIALSKEYTYRYKKIHKCQEVIEWCRQNIDKIEFPEKNLTKFPLAMPDCYKKDDPVESYRLYYIHEKSGFAKWNKNRAAPMWYKKGANII